jgi:very-short-patch-repair endonuclease
MSEPSSQEPAASNPDPSHAAEHPASASPDQSASTNGTAGEADTRAAISHAPLSLSIDLEYADRVTFALEQAGIPLVSRISLTNTGTSPISMIDLDVSIENGETQPFSAKIAAIAPGSTYNLAVNGLKLSPSKLAARTEAEKTHIHVVAKAGDAIARRDVPVDILAFDQWPGSRLFPDLLAAFSVPNHPLVADLLASGRPILARISGRDAYDGYQSGSRLRASHIAQASFESAHGLGLGYINPPSSFEIEGQRIRLVDRLLREKMGCCIDHALLLTSLWEQSGLHPLVLLIEGHAMPAVWTHEAHLPEPAIDDAARVRNLIKLGEIIPVESTLLTERHATFKDAVDEAINRLENPGKTFCAIDIRCARKRGVRPLPLRTEGDQTIIEVPTVRPGSSTATVIDAVSQADRFAAEDPGQAARNAEPPHERVKRWQSRLLDLSLNNRLINFRETAKTLKLEIPDLPALENAFADEKRFSISSKTDGDEAFRKEQQAKGTIYSAAPLGATQASLLTLYRTRRATIEETGANPLYLAVGMLTWYESEVSELVRRAPILLLPVELTRSVATNGYRYDLSLSDEPIRPNVTLLEKLRMEFGIDDPTLSQLPEDDRGIDVARVFHNFRTAIKGINRWEVVETAYLGLFSFNKFLMWRDLQDHLDMLKKNRLVSHLLSGPRKVFESRPLPTPDTLDDDLAPGDLLCTRDADSSQLAAIRAASEGGTFVLEGPPGTGKSQTIANMIADAIGRGKRVLFVAEKMAALGVVRDRLDKDGLGTFCLELHSAKASKKEVLSQLDLALREPAMAAPEDWNSLCTDLARERTILNTYIRTLHKRRESGESLYQVAGRLATLKDGPAIAPAVQSIAATTADQLAAWRSALAELVRTAAPLDPVSTHDLRGITRSQWSFSLPDQARTSLADATTRLRAFRDAITAFIRASNARLEEADITPSIAAGLAALSELLPGYPRPHRDLLLGHDAKILRARMTETIALGRSRDARRAELLKTYRPELLDTDPLPHLDRISRAAAKSGLFGLWPRFSARKSMQAYCTGTIPSLETLKSDLESTLQLRRDSQTLTANTDASRLFGTRWNNAQPSWDELAGIIGWSESFERTSASLNTSPHGTELLAAIITTLENANPATDLLTAARTLIAATAAWTTSITTLDATLKAATLDFSASQSPWLEGLATLLERWTRGLPDLNAWCTWRDVRDRAAAINLLPIITAYENNKLELSTLSPTFERGYGTQWYNTIADAQPPIREFNARTHHGHIDRFNTLDKQILARGHREVRGRLSKDHPDVTQEVSAQSELGILKRELARKARHMPTRRLIGSIPNLLARLKPCFLMSPLSVAQYLDAKLPPFDLVIFDEASQIPVWDSIGAIARGKEVIVVGDSKQLPPTSFFSITEDDDSQEPDESTVDDTESILQECNASNIPSMWLSWHYRSKHESLIAFSNYHYYNNRLHTFPSPIDRSDEFGVTFRYVPDALYDRGSSRTNRKEAELVVEEIVRLLTTNPAPGTTHDSIGVVTFNQTQQTLIEDLLDAKRCEFPEIDRFFTDQVPEPVFVKNLENVQGDERDIIMFSVTYGPYVQGKPPSMYFGPLNGSGGERRLNVAITRARKKLRVFSSIRADQLDLGKARGVGVRHFKTFLDYADRGPQAIAEAVTLAASGTFDSGFEQAVCEALTARNWQVDSQVGCAGYRVDLAVRDPARPGRYLLGIECDGAAYHSGKTARDRDRLRESVLRSLGWEIARVWSTDWYINPTRCIETIEAAIKRAQDAPPKPRSAPAAVQEKTLVLVQEPTSATAPATHAPTDESSSLFKSAPSTLSRPAEKTSAEGTHNEYRPTDIKLRPGSRDVYSDAAFSHAVDAVRSIVMQESPITAESLIRTLAELFGVARITDRARERLVHLSTHALSQIGAHVSDGVIWISIDAPSSYTTFRIAGDNPDSFRELDTIPVPELVNAVVYVVRMQIGIPSEDLEREVGRLFGVLRMTQRAREVLSFAVTAAESRGLIVIKDSIASLARN